VPDLFPHIGINRRVVRRVIGIGERIILFQCFNLKEDFFLFFYDLLFLLFGKCF
jgi:hypothetical protein